MNNWINIKELNLNKINNLLNLSIKDNRFSNNGPNVQLLENTIKNLYEIDDDKVIVAVCNGSIAIQLLAKAIDIYHNKNINWCSQSFTFPPSVQMNLSECQIVDIDLDGGINLEELDNNIEGLIITNVFGNIVDIDKYVNFCKNNNKYLIFDNAATHYTFYKNKNCLNYGIGSSISFHHTKPMGFGEGGAIIINKEYENIVRSLINFGYGLEEKFSIYSKYGTNGKMSDISAVYIIQYLEDHFETIINKHQELFNYLENKLKENNLNIQLYPSFHDKNKNCVSCFCLLFENYETSIKIEKILLDNDIFCRKYYHPLKETKNTVYIYNKILCLPCNIDMNVQDIDNIIKLLKDNL
jgi:dTDP-4-amino-4,6-dideoxygalactose transaminase